VYLIQPFETRSFAFVEPMLTSLQSLSAYMRSKDFVDAVARSRTATGTAYGMPSLHADEFDEDEEEEEETGRSTPTPEHGIAARSDQTAIASQGTTRTGAASSRRRRLRSKSVHVVDGIVTGSPRYPCFSDPNVIMEPDATKYRVRGPTYLEDRVKVSAAPAAFRLVAADLFSFENPDERRNIGARSAICRHASDPSLSPEERLSRHTFIVNIIPPSNKNYAIVLYWQPCRPTWRTENPVFAALYDAFCNGDDAYRNRRFKLIPDLVKGPWVVRTTVRSRPALPGTKNVDLVYSKGDNWFEVDLDVSGKNEAKFITSLALPVAKSLIVDLAFLAESQHHGELPEQIIGVARFRFTDLSKSRRVPTGGDLGEGLPHIRLLEPDVASKRAGNKATAAAETRSTDVGSSGTSIKSSRGRSEDSTEGETSGGGHEHRVASPLPASSGPSKSSSGPMNVVRRFRGGHKKEKKGKEGKD
jgi:hypothetical protein